MGKPKFQESMPRQKNPFAVLADSDSDDETNGSNGSKGTNGPNRVDVAPVVPVVPVSEDADEWVHEKEFPLTNKVDIVKSFRIWKNEVPRFTSNIFNSPFSKKGKKKDEVWTTIDTEHNTTAELENKFQSILGNKYPSMLDRGKADDEMNALAWAEKVKISLEKAKNGKKTERMSFFKRNIDEKN
jgi:hypothetical protein